MHIILSILLVGASLIFSLPSYAFSYQDMIPSALITAYNNTIDQNGSNPDITASGIKVRDGIVAVSPDLLKKGWKYGRKVLIKFHDCSIPDRICDIQDKSHPKNKNHIDLLILGKDKRARKLASDFGRKKATVYLLPEGATDDRK